MIKIITAFLLMLPIALVAQSADAAASKEDKYVACLIGQSAVAMLKQGQRLNAEAAREQAYKVCKLVGKLNPEADEGIGDYVNMMVRRMAEGCQP